VSQLTKAQRVNFGQYINDQVFPRDKTKELGYGCPRATNQVDLEAAKTKKARYKRIIETTENSPEFLKEIASWRKRDDLALGEDFDKQLKNNIYERGYDLRSAMSMIYRSIHSNIENLFKGKVGINPKHRNVGDAVNDNLGLQGGLINALSSSFGWTYATLQKTVGESVEKISTILNNNKKALNSMLKMQFTLFNLLLNKLGVQNFPFVSFNVLDEDALEFYDLKKGTVLVLKEKTINSVIKAAKEKDAAAIMRGGNVRSNPKMPLRNSSIPVGCPAGDISLESIREPDDKSMKSNLNAEVLEYLDTVVKTKVLPHLDKLRDNAKTEQ
jgi:hypothetical protein